MTQNGGTVTKHAFGQAHFSDSIAFNV